MNGYELVIGYAFLWAFVIGIFVCVAVMRSGEK